MTESLVFNISVDWFLVMKSRSMELFLIPTVLLTSITLLLNPVLLFCIMCFSSLRHESRYLLLANTLLADTLFLAINLAVVSCNAAGVLMPDTLCQLMMAGTIATYSCSVLTVTAMVVDTYVAVRWPLRHDHLLSPGRARKLVLGLWLGAAVCPLSLLVMFEMAPGAAPARPLCLVLLALHALGERMKVGVHVYFMASVTLCTLLVICCYVRLYLITRTSGIWRSRYSRARVTLLAHTLLLAMYFVPALVFAVELALLKRGGEGEAGVWIDLANMCVLMLLPRCCTPHLYILRYRDVYRTLRQLWWRRRSQGQAA